MGRAGSRSTRRSRAAPFGVRERDRRQRGNAATGPAGHPARCVASNVLGVPNSVRHLPTNARLKTDAGAIALGADGCNSFRSTPTRDLTGGTWGVGHGTGHGRLVPYGDGTNGSRDWFTSRVTGHRPSGPVTVGAAALIIRSSSSAMIALLTPEGDCASGPEHSGRVRRIGRQPFRPVGPCAPGSGGRVERCSGGPDRPG